jgi:hypothetical protein
LLTKTYCYLYAPRQAAIVGACLVALALLPGTASADGAPWTADPAESLQQSSKPLLLVRVASRDVADADESDAEEDEADIGAHDPVSVAGSRDYRWTAADVLAARSQATPRARCIIDREVGGFGYDPWRRGLAGERGPVQLHPRGLLPEFLSWSGGQAPENPYAAVAFLEYKLRQGQGRHWSPVRLGLC